MRLSFERKAEQAAEVYQLAHSALAGQREELKRHLEDIAAQKEQMRKLLALSRELSEGQLAKLQEQISLLSGISAASYASEILARKALEKQVADLQAKLTHVQEQYEKVAGLISTQGGALGEKGRELVEKIKRPFREKPAEQQ
jgi:hypothetical protein